jgi:hypothetical protein
VCTGTWRATNLPGAAAVLRCWVSSAEDAVASANALLHFGSGNEIGKSWLEFSTLHADGTLVGTATLRRSRFRRRYHTVGKMHDAPGASDPAELKRRHERNCAPFLARGPRHVAPSEVRQMLVDFFRRDSEFRCRVGLWKRDPDGDRPTLRGAVLLSLDALDPITAELTPAHWLAALAISFGLPFLAEGPLVALAGAPAGFGATAAVAGALALGALLGHRGVFWGPLLLDAGLRLAGTAPGNAFLFVLSTQAAALASMSLAGRLRSRF